MSSASKWISQPTPSPESTALFSRIVNLFPIVSVQENIINGTVTNLLLADNCHPNAAGYAFMGNVMFERLYDIGAFDAIFDYYDSLDS